MRLIMFVVSDKIQEKIIEFYSRWKSERDLDNLPSECRTRGRVQKRTRNRRIEEDRSWESSRR